MIKSENRTISTIIYWKYRSIKCNPQIGIQRLLHFVFLLMLYDLLCPIYTLNINPFLTPSYSDKDLLWDIRLPNDRKCISEHISRVRSSYFIAAAAACYVKIRDKKPTSWKTSCRATHDSHIRNLGRLIHLCYVMDARLYITSSSSKKIRPI